jgi:hypothetical protein
MVSTAFSAAYPEEYVKNRIKDSNMQMSRFCFSESVFDWYGIRYYTLPASFASRSRTPFRKEAASTEEYFLAISRASLMVTADGMSCL